MDKRGLRLIHSSNQVQAPLAAILPQAVPLPEGQQFLLRVHQRQLARLISAAEQVGLRAIPLPADSLIPGDFGTVHAQIISAELVEPLTVDRMATFIQQLLDTKQ